MGNQVRSIPSYSWSLVEAGSRRRTALHVGQDILAPAIINDKSSFFWIVNVYLATSVCNTIASTEDGIICQESTILDVLNTIC